MSSTIDSKPEFAKRVRTIGLSGFTDEFTAQGWETFGDFAFAGNYTPGATDDTKFTNEVTIRILGDLLTT